MPNDRLRTTIRTNGHTEATFADELGVDAKTVQRWVTQNRQGCGQSITAVHGAVMSRVMAVSRPLSNSASRMVAAVPSKPS
jgi:hypothetical protein